MNLSTRLTGPLLLLSRTVWMLTAIVPIALWIAGGYSHFSAPLPSCVSVSCDPFGLSIEDIAVMRSLGLPAEALLAFWNAGAVLSGIVFFTTSLLIYWRRSEDVFSLIVAFFLIFLGGVAFTEFDDAASRAYPSLQPWMDGVFSLGWGAMVIVFFYFPDGRIVPARRELVWAVILFVLLLGSWGSGPARGFNLDLAGIALIVILGGGLWAQSYRYRRVSGAVQKQQTKWVLFGLIGSLLIMLLWIWMSIAHPSSAASPQRIYHLLWVRPLIIVLVAFLPLSILFSILRYRLWDIDILIRRTLSYGLLTGILLAVYFTAVVILQFSLSLVSGEAGSPLVTVASTLAIAALFNPLRQRVQNFIDRRFYRQKFDADLTLAHFAAAARDEVDLEVLTVALLGVVDETVQPERISLWLLGPDDL